jgi:phenylalanyl-tRNA synthetase beta chain
MKVPLSWLKDFVDITLPIEDLAQRLTLAGLEVEEIHYVGLPMPRMDAHTRHEAKITGIDWDPEKIVVAAVSEVLPHPNADRLVLCRLDDGQQEQIVLTGAPNLFPYKGKGPLEALRGGPIKVAYAKEGARIYDGHQPGQVLTTLKRAKIRGVDSYSMACSEKELGISEDHEGIIFLDEDAPVGVPLVDYMGDAVFEIALTPNIARDANMLGVAREIAALTSQPLRQPSLEVLMQGSALQGRISIEVTDPPVNPRFVVGLIEGVEIKPSPYRVQRRLRLAGVRAINNVVDATNYVMLEIGQPLHAFDFDVLKGRAGGKAPRIITRLARPGERLKTLDGVERTLDDFTVMVTDQSGGLALAGVMGGAESEVSQATRNVLLEGAAWNMINTRRTVLAQSLPSEAAYRFSRGVHPAMTERGVRRGLELMRQWSGGIVAQGLVDNYPLPAQAPVVEFTPADVERWLGIRLPAEEIVRILESIEFHCEQISSNDSRISTLESRTVIRATPPDHRLDIGEGVIGRADVMEEIARLYGYDRIPETRMADALPPQRGNPALEVEERTRDLLVGMGLQEVITYRTTSPDREGRLYIDRQPPASQPPYLRLSNPITSDRVVMRQSLLASVLDVVERNARLFPRQALFEIGPIFLPADSGGLPQEASRLVIVLTGPRVLPGWQPADVTPMDFYDLKGILSALAEELRIPEVRYLPGEHASFHPGRCAQIVAGATGGRSIGALGELHPLVREHYLLPEAPLLAADLDLEAILSLVPERFDITPVPAFPPVLEDLAFIVDDAVPAEQVAEAIRQAGGKTLSGVRLFDVYRGGQIGAGKKSLAYSLTYLSPDRTLTDKEVAQIRGRIVRRLEEMLGAKLRG